MTRRTVWMLLVGLAGVSPLACESATGPGGLPVDVVMEPLSGALLLPAATVAGDQLTLTGPIGTPNPCYSFRATATRLRDTLQVRLIGARSAEACIEVLGQFRYSLTVRDMPSGPWQVVLDYHGPDSMIPEVLFRGAVRVN